MGNPLVMGLIARSSQRPKTDRTFVLGFGAAALIACLTLVAGPARAAEDVEPNTFEITPFFGLMAGGSFEDPATGEERDVDDDSNYGLFLNLIADVPERQYELLYASQSSVIEGGVPIDLDIQYLQIGGTVAYPQMAHVSPYFGITAGAARLKPDQTGLDDETKLSFSIGGGVRFPITRHFGIRFDVRGFVTLLEDDSEIFCVSEGNASCLIRPKSETFVQYTASLGVSFGF